MIEGLSRPFRRRAGTSGPALLRKVVAWGGLGEWLGDSLRSGWSVAAVGAVWDGSLVRVPHGGSLRMRADAHASA